MAYTPLHGNINPKHHKKIRWDFLVLETHTFFVD